MKFEFQAQASMMATSFQQFGFIPTHEHKQTVMTERLTDSMWSLCVLQEG